MKKNKLLDDKRVVLLVAIVVAALSWIIIAGFVNPGSRIPLENVLIDYERGSQAYTDQNLQIVGNPESSYADVQVQGDGSVLGNLSSEESVTVYVDYSAVKGPGEYELPLRVERLSSGFTVTGVTVTTSGHSLDRNPKNTATVTFEEIARTTFSIGHRTENVKPADENLVKGPITVEPTEVTITGPKTKVDQIAQVVAVVAEEEELTETKRYTGVPLVLIDKNGDEMDQSEMSLVFSNPTATVTVAIWERRTINLDVGLTGVSQAQDFDAEWLRSKLILSEDTLKVVGPSSAFEHLDDPLLIHEVDVSALEPAWVSNPISITLPEGLTAEDKLVQVTVTLDSTEMKEVTIEVTEDNIKVINQPTNTTVTPVADSISVRLLGTADQIEALLAENVRVQLDASSVTSGGGRQQTVPARILIPKYNRMFAISGEDGYTMVCDVEVNG
ncbi:hypothetical protein LJC60_01285 [Ruminococcaceae bacterium OttesenSCG-928-D13]|nr:hypothetical protein [Ruminococcaceae bacterium OttesenSCG-928-D13]